MLRMVLVPVFVSAIVGGMLTSPLSAQTREEKVRNDKQKVEAQGYWIYNDVPRAFAEARKSGKPIVAVLRCLPCVECVKLDDDIIDADERIKPLLEQFVRVRIVSTNGLNLNLFQFDTDQSFAVFLLNADGTIYGRFGTRSSRTEWIGDVSVDGLAKALSGALTLHKAYPANRVELAGKRGPEPEFASPELLPPLKGKYKSTLNYEGQVVQSCIHCHQIGDATRALILGRQEKLPETVLFPYPHPKTYGLILDPKEMATVLAVEPDSVAGQAGFKAGDVIRKLAGQPILSIADVQWVLQSVSPDGGEVLADVRRAEEDVRLTLKFEQGWRQKEDIAWRSSTWELRKVALGGMFLGEVSDEDRQKWKLPPASLALVVKHVGLYSPHDIAHRAGVRKGDILIGLNSRTDLLRETDLIAYVLQNFKAGQQLDLTFLRDGKQQSLKITLP